MSRYYFKLYLLSALLVYSCGKSGFLNRSYHYVTTYYNILFHAEKHLKKAENKLVNSYKIDFADTLLYVEDFVVNDDLLALVKEDLEKVEEKVEKIVQLHSVVVDDQEFNELIDNAYVVLGKSLYYQNKHIGALDAFNYIKIKYAGSDMYSMAMLWSIKIKIDMGNMEGLLERNGSFLKDINKYQDEELRKQIYKNQFRLLVANGKNKEAINIINKMIGLSDGIEKVKYRFILGQLYKIDKNYGMSNNVFNKIIEDDYSSSMTLNAKISIMSNFDAQNDDKNKLLTQANKMLKAVENEDQKVRIYYQIANINLKTGDTSKAYEYLKKLEALNPEGNRILIDAYEKMADIDFNKFKYESAYGYYSKLVELIKEKDNRKLIKAKIKKNALNMVVKNINKIREVDSIIQFNMLDDKDKIEKIKNMKKLAMDKPKEQIKKKTTNKLNITKDLKLNFFYNPKIIKFSKSQFKKLWGDRSLQDDWRIKRNRIQVIDKKEFVDNGGEEIKEEKAEFVDISGYNMTYSAEDIINMKRIKQLSYYNLALIYKEQFENYKLSFDTFRELIKLDVIDAIKPAVYYHMAILSLKLNLEIQEYKDKLAKEFPDSRYNYLLNNLDKNKEFKSKYDDPFVLYERAYSYFSKGQFKKSLELIENIISNYPIHKVVSKCELLKSFCLIKLNKNKEYKDNLEYIIIAYSDSKEAELSKLMLNRLDKFKEDQNIYKLSPNDKHRVLFVFEDKDDVMFILDYLVRKYSNSKELNIKKIDFTDKKKILSIYEFMDQEKAIYFLNNLETDNTFLVKKQKVKLNIMVISEINYEKLIKTKRLVSYKRFFNGKIKWKI